MTANKRTLTTGEAAQYCGVSFRTVIRWIEKGRLKAYQLPGRGDNRIPIKDFIDFLQENQFPIPEELAEFSENNDRILIIDDDVSMAKAIKRAISAHPYEIKMIHNSFEAGAELVEFKPHLITLDLSMPGMDGFQVLKSIRAHYKKPVKVLILSALPQPELEKTLLLGADDFIKKPFKSEVLSEKIKNLLDAIKK